MSREHNSNETPAVIATTKEPETQADWDAWDALPPIIKKAWLVKSPLNFHIGHLAADIVKAREDGHDDWSLAMELRRTAFEDTVTLADHHPGVGVHPQARNA